MSSPKSPTGIAEDFVAIGIEGSNEEGGDFDSSLEKQVQPAINAVPASEILPQASERQELLVEELDSVLPILKLFNGLVSINDTYYIQGGASQHQLLHAASIARNITKFTVTDPPEDTYNEKIHSGAFLRLVQLLNPVTHSTVLFPNLLHLRVDRAAASADQLTLFCAPSLKTLELIDVPNDRQDVLRVFLRILADTSKGLENITLQGPVQTTLLTGVLLFNQLRHLHIKAATTITTGFLKSLRSLPSLEAFHLDISKAKYVRYTSSTSASESVTAALTPFHRVSKLHITGVAELIEDILGMVSSKNLDELSLVYQWPTPSTLAMPKKLPGMSLLESRKIRKRLATREASTSASAQNPFFCVLNSALQNWKDTLRIVEIGICIGESEDAKPLEIVETTAEGSDNVPPFIIPEMTFDLLMSMKLRELRIADWRVDSNYDVIQHLRDAQRTEIQALKLPAVAEGQVAISLSQLSAIAQDFPMLHSLTCPLDFDALQDNNPLPFPAKALSHPLRHLGVWYTKVPDDEHLLVLARYIDYLFPEVDSVFSMVDAFTEEEKKTWRLLGGLVKLCQDVRKDDVSRRISGDSPIVV